MHDDGQATNGAATFAGGRGRGGKDLRPRLSAEKLFDKTPPHSVEAEQSLLGAMLLDPSVVGDVIALVNKPEQFYDDKHGHIFQAIVDVYDTYQSGDVLQIVERLRDQKVIDRVGGPDYLADLAEMVPSAVNAPHYARIVAEKSRLRRLIDTAGEILYDAYHAPQDADSGRELLDRAEQSIFEIAQQQQTSEPENLAELLHQQLDIIERAEGMGITGIRSGFDDLDEMTSGLQPGEMLILAARPSMGKTALALNLAEQIALGGRTPWSPPSDDQPVSVGFFSLEMSRGSLVQRLISARSGVDSHRLRTGNLTMEDWERIQRAVGVLGDAPIYIDDTPGLTVLGLRAKARRMASKYNIRCLVIDYLQLLSAPSAARDGRQNEVSLISRQIKALARELKLPVICLAQLNRGAEQRERNRPRMSDLRESGSIEQDADVVMLLHREAYYHKDDEEWLHDPENADKINLTELIIAKQRNGPTGVVKLTFDSEITRFKNHDFRHGYADAASYEAPRRGEAQSRGEAAGRAEPRQQVGAFGGRAKTGPIEGHRDGGGSDNRPSLEDEISGQMSGQMNGDQDDEPPF